MVYGGHHSTRQTEKPHGKSGSASRKRYRKAAFSSSQTAKSGAACMTHGHLGNASTQRVVDKGRLTMDRHHVILRLTPLEARELWQVAINGYADGDYYQPGYGGKRKENAYLAAHEKLAKAISNAKAWNLPQIASHES
jgi:hypothetical protein